MSHSSSARPRVRSPCVLSSYYILDRRTAPSDRTAPKFGTHVRMDSLTLKKMDPPPPQGGLGGYLLLTNLSRRNAPKLCTHVRIYSLTSKKNVTHPHPRGFRGLSIVKNISRRNAPKLCTHVRIDTLTLKK